MCARVSGFSSPQSLVVHNLAERIELTGPGPRARPCGLWKSNTKASANVDPI